MIKPIFGGLCHNAVIQPEPGKPLETMTGDSSDSLVFRSRLPRNIGKRPLYKIAATVVIGKWLAVSFFSMPKGDKNFSPPCQAHKGETKRVLGCRYFHRTWRL